LAFYRALAARARATSIALVNWGDLVEQAAAFGHLPADALTAPYVSDFRQGSRRSFLWFRMVCRPCRA
jgi:hypothetical protein